MVAAHVARGDTLALRIEGEHFTALGFVNRAGPSGAVRIVTARGIALSLDADARASAGSRSHTLLEGPVPSTHDADGDGFEEVFVQTRTAQATCVRVFRVLDVGFVDEVPVKLALFGKELCATDVQDVDGDGHAELLADIALERSYATDGASQPAPRVRLALWARDHGFSLDPSSARATQFYAEERDGRAGELAEARRALDTTGALRLAIELAALSHVHAETPGAQVRAFNAALAGLVLTEAQASAARAFRARIHDAWNVTRPAPSPAAK